MSRRLVVFACLWAVVLLVPAASSSKSDEVGGQPVTVGQAPWAVLVVSNFTQPRVGLCSGSLIDPSHVVTAAHCEYDDGGNQISPAAIEIIAGISNFATLASGDAPQAGQVISYRIHPRFVQPATGVHDDDVAVLTLATPVALGADVQTIALPPPNASLQTGESAELFGFGQEDPLVDPNGQLNGLGLTVGDQADCAIDGTDGALWICASTPSGAACHGDSGGGLVLPSAPPMLIGTTVGVEDGCPAGSISAFTNLTAPEIGDFVRGNDNPPMAPRLTVGASIESSEYPDVGTALTCDPGQWTGDSPIGYAYTFYDSSTQASLQAGPSATYVLQPSDVGRTIACVVAATNDGGTGQSVATNVSPTIAVAPQVHAAPKTIARGRSGALAVTIVGSVDQGPTRACAVPPASVAAASCVTVPGTTNGGHTATARIPLTVKKTAKTGRFRVRVQVTYPDGRPVAVTSYLTVRR